MMDADSIVFPTKTNSFKFASAPTLHTRCFSNIYPHFILPTYLRDKVFQINIITPHDTYDWIYAVIADCNRLKRQFFPPNYPLLSLLAGFTDIARLEKSKQ